MSQLKDMKASFPKWNVNELETLSNKLPKEGVDLLQKMLVYDPIDRISCE